MPKTIILYSQPGCTVCDRVKQYFSENEVEYTEKNIREDRAALAELLDHGFRSTPVTFVDGEAVVGFDGDKFESLLGDTGSAKS